MPDLDLDAIAARHQPEPAKCYWHHNQQPGLPIPHPSGEQLCRECTTDDYDAPWPCDAAALVAEVRRLRAEVDGLKQTQTANAARVIGP